MIPVVIYPHYLQVDHIGLSTDPKPDRANKGAIYFERDTELTSHWDGKEWIEDPKGIFTRNLLWNTESWEFELATTGTSPSAAIVNVENFPAVISGTVVPISGEISNPNDDPTSKYKITDIDSTPGNQYFGYVDADGAWYIMNLTATAARYARGDSGYAAAWGVHGDLDLFYFNEIF